MKIAFIGAQNSGKSTLVEEFIKEWPMYKKPEKTYRDIIKDKDLKLNKEGDKRSQKAILDALIEEAQTACTSEEKFLVFDRCVIDNMAYTLWHYAKGTEGFTEEFVIDSKTLAALSLKYFDVVFYVPVRYEIQLAARENRDIDPVFVDEIDNIYRAMVESYEKSTGAFFPLEDCPAVIPLEGPPDMRLQQIKLYIKDSGICYGEEDGSLLDVSQI